MYSVAIKVIMKIFGLKLLTTAVNIEGKLLHYAEVNRPALQLAGFYDYFNEGRLQVIGMVEYTYLEKLSEADRFATIQKIFTYKLPCLVICRGLTPFPEMLECATKSDIPVFSYEGSTTEFLGEIIRWLRVELAPRVTMHGVLIDIFGEGVLITGESGIGKSETALELVKRGHRLVADDSVEIKRASRQTLVGTSPELIRYFIELRGIGIIDVKQMYGVESVRATMAIDLVISLEAWDRTKEYDRLGLVENYIDILGNKVVCHTIPIRPGRNIAIICEAAAINYRQKKMGYNAAKTLEERVSRNINKNKA